MKAFFKIRPRIEGTIFREKCLKLNMTWTTSSSSTSSYRDLRTFSPTELLVKKILLKKANHQRNLLNKLAQLQMKSLALPITLKIKENSIWSYFRWTDNHLSFIIFRLSLFYAEKLNSVAIILVEHLFRQKSLDNYLL